MTESSSPLCFQSPIQFNLGDNGAYSYSYESRLEDGGRIAQRESGDGSGSVTGHYSLGGSDGRIRKVDYTAGQAGFRASVDTNEFDTTGDAPAHVMYAASLAGPAAQSFMQQQQGKMYSSPAHPKAPAPEPIQQTQHFGATFQSAPVEGYQGSQQEQQPSKPSPYAFSYDSQLDDGSSSRTESGDASGKVVGSYSLTGSDGRRRTVNYQADQDGFRASVDTNELGTKADSPANVQFLSSAPHQAAPQPIQQKQLSGAALFQSSAPAMRTTYQSSQQGQSSVQYNAAAQQQPLPYSFSYDTQLEDGSSSRTESGDGSGKVVGSYGLSAADGRFRKVEYLADEGGFRATVNTNEFGTKADSPADIQFYSSAKVEEPKPYSGASSSSMYHSSTQQQNPIQFNLGDNGAYSYSYESRLEDGGSIAQRESGDGSGSVTGHYSLGGSDGRIRTVDYTAGQAGFRASVDTNEFGTKSDSPAHVTFLSAADVGAAPVASPVAFKAPAPKATPHRSSGSASVHSSVLRQEKVEAPAPYAFNYDTEGAARQEMADGSGTVTGTYTVRQEDGSLRVVEYIADKDGFRANVKTNEPGTLGGIEAAAKDTPHSTPKATPHHAPKSPSAKQPERFSSFGKSSQKSSMISQKRIEAWSR
ncbi:uncharacterized protein LOC129226168 [Uloborus diversus]|uniref:uncharacterized protein LOC129226168 n=1 Tax=Uloborus diversus TaxID=327109 RepID=UPI0024098D75|nr:uncharacterized protein LOC129226168 [Uloborus diversus]